MAQRLTNHNLQLSTISNCINNAFFDCLELVQNTVFEQTIFDRIGQIVVDFDNKTTPIWNENRLEQSSILS